MSSTSGNKKKRIRVHRSKLRSPIRDVNKVELAEIAISKKLKKKLIKPYIPPDNKIGISAVKEAIDNNYFLHKKWTIIRDISGYCLKNYLSYRSAVIDMDTVTDKSGEYISGVMKNSIKNGLWVTFSFKNQVCSMEEYIAKGVVPSNLMTPDKFLESQTAQEDIFGLDEKNIKWCRVIFVTSKLELPQFMLDTCNLISIDDDKLSKENNKLMLGMLNRPKPQEVNLIHTRLEFVEACFEGDYAKVKKIMTDTNCNADTRDLHNNTALMQASLKGRLSVCKLLLSMNADNIDINSVNDDNKNALHKAAYNGSAEIIELLLKNGCDPRIIDSSGYTAMDYINNFECKLIMRNCSTQSKMADQLNKLKADQQKDFEKLFLECAEMSLKMKQKLKKYLVEKAQNGDYKKIHMMVSAGKASVETRDENGHSLLSVAIIHSKTECATKLVQELGANVNSFDHKGWTPLMNAAFNGSLKICKLLVLNDADINAKNCMNMDALELASTIEIKDFIKDEQRKHNLFSFEQMLDLAKSANFLQHKSPIGNNDQYDNSEGNLGVFEASMRRPKRNLKNLKSRNRYKNRGKELIKSMDNFSVGSSSIQSKDGSTKTPSSQKRDSKVSRTYLMKSYLKSKKSKFVNNIKQKTKARNAFSPKPDMGHYRFIPL